MTPPTVFVTPPVTPPVTALVTPPRPPCWLLPAPLLAPVRWGANAPPLGPPGAAAATVAEDDDELVSRLAGLAVRTQQQSAFAALAFFSGLGLADRIASVTAVGEWAAVAEEQSGGSGRCAITGIGHADEHRGIASVTAGATAAVTDQARVAIAGRKDEAEPAVAAVAVDEATAATRDEGEVAWRTASDEQPPGCPG